MISTQVEMPTWQYLLVSKCCQEPLATFSPLQRPPLGSMQAKARLADGMVGVVSGGDNVTRMFS